MKNLTYTLYLEINNSNYIFFVCKGDKQYNFEIDYKLEVALIGIDNNRISDFEKSFNAIKKNIYLIEQKFNHTFKEIVIILDNLNPSFINITGYKKLNSSQISKENITYILNTLKSYVDEIELKKTILHIFNSKFYLDKKKIENLPIGLFGDFYSHELSFTLINKNDFKNIKHIFDKCNLKIKKILIKDFVRGANISSNYDNVETFFQIKINQKFTKIFYFENNSLKNQQNFKFGSDIIIKDISKIISLKIETIQTILNESEFKEEILEDELIEEKFFKNEVYRKIKKKLIYDIAFARIKEILDIIIIKNINFKYYIKNSKNIFLELDSRSQYKCFKKIYLSILADKSGFNLNLIDNLPDHDILNSVNKIVHFGWKKEAIPFSQVKKSIIARFFDTFFK
jgi:cell division protein FtsA